MPSFAVLYSILRKYSSSWSILRRNPQVDGALDILLLAVKNSTSKIFLKNFEKTLAKSSEVCYLILADIVQHHMASGCGEVWYRA